MNIVPVNTIRGEARVSSRDLAAALGNQHKNVMSLLSDYQVEFEGLGHLPFETETVENSVGAKNQARFALLNENQCYFLLTLVRNSDVVVALKLELVKAFARARELPTQAIPALPADPMLAQLEIMMAMRTGQLELEQRTGAIERQLDRTPISFYHDKEGEILAQIHKLARVHPRSYSGAHRAFKEAFGTATAPLAKYSSLPACRFEEAVAWLSLQIKTFSAQRPLLDEASD